MLKDMSVSAGGNSFLNQTVNNLALNYDQEKTSSYTHFVNIIFNQNNIKLFELNNQINITSYCSLYFRSLREVDKLEDSKLIRSLANEFNFNKMYTCDLNHYPNRPECSRFYFFTHDHKYKIF